MCSGWLLEQKGKETSGSIVLLFKSLSVLYRHSCFCEEHSLSYNFMLEGFS